jgi:hypothetical protein
VASDPRKPSLTPIPHADVAALTSAITGTRENMKAIKDTLQDVAKDARKASDGVIQLTSWSKDFNRRINSLEQAPTQHCLKEAELVEHEGRLNDSERISRAHGEKITAVEKEQAGLTKWRTWLTTLSATVILAIAGAAGKAIWDTATAKATITQNAEDIKELEKARREDREAIIRAVNGVPSRVQKVILVPSSEPNKVDIVEVNKKLHPYQQRQLKRLLEQAGMMPGDDE